MARVLDESIGLVVEPCEQGLADQGLPRARLSFEIEFDADEVARDEPFQLQATLYPQSTDHREKLDHTTPQQLDVGCLRPEGAGRRWVEVCEPLSPQFEAMFNRAAGDETAADGSLRYQYYFLTSISLTPLLQAA